MNANRKSHIALPLSPAISPVQGHADTDSLMPAEFAGMYQSGFETGYEQGHQSGYDKGFVAGMAAVRQGPANGAATTAAVEGKPAPKTGPRRMLIGMPCKRCGVYLMTDETHCPCCKQAKAA